MDLSELQKSLEQGDEDYASEYSIPFDDSISEESKKLFDHQKSLQHVSTTPQWRGRPPTEQGPLNDSITPQTTSIEEMSSRVNFVWADHILYVTTIRPAFVNGTAVWTLVEDTNGHTLAMSLWNYLPIHQLAKKGKSQSAAIIEEEIPADTHIAIHQPLLVPNYFGSNNKRIPMLRVDNPTCIELFDLADDRKWKQTKPNSSTPLPTISTLAELKQLADEAFQKQAYQSSCRKYQRILQVLGKEDDNEDHQRLEMKMNCWTNLSDSQLQLGRYEEAAKSAGVVIKDPFVGNVKAQEILARALFHLGQPNQAKDILMDLRNNVKDDPKLTKSIQSLLGDCLQAIMEEKMGSYNLRKMIVEASLYTELPFHADYKSSKIDLGVQIVRPSDGMEYRGVLANADIAEGTLLTSTRAFAFAHTPRITTNSAKAAAQKKDLYEVQHVHRAVQHLMNRPSLASPFYRLEAAGKINHDDQKTTARSSTGPIIDLVKIGGILESNRFGIDVKHPSSPIELKAPSEEAEGDPVGVGLWLDTSMFNHSCTPNAAWTPIGNQMMVYASKDIPKGSEVCISYVHVASSYEDRKERFSKWSGGKGFECGCEWCHLLRSNDELCTMNEEVQKAHQRLTASDEQFDSINEVLSKSRRKRIGKVHAKVAKRFQHSMYTIHMMEALQHANDGYRESARDSVEAAVALGYEIRGGLRQETRTQDLCCLAAVYMTCNEDAKAKSVLETLCRHQLVLPSKFEDFQTFVMMSSMTFWGPYQNEAFMQRWAILNQQVWEARSKLLK